MGTESALLGRYGTQRAAAALPCPRPCAPAYGVLLKYNEFLGKLYPTPHSLDVQGPSLSPLQAISVMPPPELSGYTEPVPSEHFQFWFQGGFGSKLS